MRGTLAGSAVHVVLLALLMLVRTSGTVVVPGPDIVQVALLGEPPPPPAPAPVVRPTDTVVPDESDGVRIQKDRPKPKPEVKQQPKPKEPPPPDARPARDEVPPTTAPRSRVVLPYAPVGGGMAGQVAVDESNFEFAYYLQMVRAQVARNWTPPAGSTPGARVVVRFRIARSGRSPGCASTPAAATACSTSRPCAPSSSPSSSRRYRSVTPGRTSASSSASSTRGPHDPSPPHASRPRGARPRALARVGRLGTGR